MSRDRSLRSCWRTWARRSIKVEEPKHGDPFRGWGERNYAATFCSLNRNKKSITLDLRTDEGRDIAFKLMPAPTY